MRRSDFMIHGAANTRRLDYPLKKERDKKMDDVELGVKKIIAGRLSISEDKILPSAAFVGDCCQTQNRRRLRREKTPEIQASQSTEPTARRSKKRRRVSKRF